MLPTVFGEFRVVADPELRFTQSGKGVASVRLVASKSKQVEENGEKKWVDDKVIWLTGTMWNSDAGREAENLCESVGKGDLVEIRGQLFERKYTTNEGVERTSVEVNLYSIAPSTRWNTVKINKSERVSAEHATAADSGTSGAPADDPWATPSREDEPPF
jgi:single-strand DNA-binding protein